MISVIDRRNCEKEFSRLTLRIEKGISGIFKGKFPRSLYDPCSYVLASGGKRLRPFLVLASGKMVGSAYNKVFNASLGVELLHNFTLVHDDIMDNAVKRRGRPTLHIKYDVNTAILAGDNLIAAAYEYLIRDCKNRNEEAIETFTHGIIEVCEGQSMDKEFESRNDVSMGEYICMIQKKTAALAEMCCAVGALIGGGNLSQIRNLKTYGRNLGLAFQIQDDLLDIAGDEKRFGKKTGGDLIEGKKTYLFLKAIEKTGGDDRKMLEEVMRRKGIHPSDVPKFRQLYIRTGVIDDTKQEIKKYTNAALKALSRIDYPGIPLLYWLAEKLLIRDA